MMRKLILSLLILPTLYADGLPNPSSRSEEVTFNLFAKALYWYPSESLDWAFTLSNTLTSVDTAYKSFVFDWAPGVSVGLGYNMQHDDWDTQASYTWFQAKTQDQANGSVTPGFLSARLSFLEPFTQGSASFHLNYQMLNWDLGRSFLMSTYLLVRPSIGVKGGWILQKVRSSWSRPGLFDTTISAWENLKQRFKGVGPKGALSGKWELVRSARSAFSLNSRIEAGYLWGHWDIEDRFTDIFSSVITVDTTPRRFGSLVLHGLFGFGWDVNLRESHFVLDIGYEFEDWFNQLQFFTNIAGSMNSDLLLQGLNCALFLEF